MTTYYIKDSLVYSSKKKQIMIPHDFESFLSSKSSFDDINEENILEVLNEYKEKGEREYSIYGLIDNFEEIKDTLNKAKKQKPDTQDYSFVEITSQLLVLEQLKDIVLTVEANFPPEKIIKLLDDVEHQHIEKKKILEKEHKKLNEKYERELEKYNKLKHQEIEKKEKRNADLKKEITTLKQEEEKYEKLLDSKTREYLSSKELRRLDESIKQLNFEKEALEFDIELLQAKVKTLKNEYKLGIRKKVHPLALIGTLGLIYWTKYSTTAHHIKAKQLSILKKQEKIMHIKKKLFVAEHKKETLTQQHQDTAKKQAKEQEDIATSLENIQNKIAQQEEELKQSQKELDKAHERVEPIEESLEEHKKTLNKLEKELEKYSASAKEEGFSIIKDIQAEHKKTIESIDSYHKQLESQKINYEGEAVITI